MKNLQTIITVLLAGAVFYLWSGDTNKQHADYAANLEIAKEFMILHGTEDSAKQREMLHDSLLWQPPMYGFEQYGKEEHMKALKGYHDRFDSIKFTADNWLPGVLAETGELDGSVRPYGKWTGIDVESGKKFNLTSYHTLDFKDGKISAGGDYFDVGGLFSSFVKESAE